MTLKKILFIEPPREYWFIMGEYLPPPTTLLTLAAYLERELPELEIEVLDCQAAKINWNHLEHYIEQINPDVVLTSGFTCNVYSCVRTAEITKKLNPNIHTIVGGIHFSFTPEESLHDYPEIDIIVRGEGEQTLKNLICALQNQTKIGNINGISFRHKNKIIHTPPQPLIDNLDTLPYPAYHLVENYIKKYHFSMMAGKSTRYMLLEGSRGCEYQCTFCTQWKHWQNKWRTKSIKRIADEIEFLNETYGGVFLWFTDDNINLAKRGKKLYKALNKKPCKEDIMLFLQARTDDIAKHNEVLQKLRSVGTYWVMTGVENNSTKTLNEYKKGTKKEDAVTAMKILNKNDIFSHAMFVIGNRCDSHQSIKDLRQYAYNLHPDFAIYTVLTPFPGTKYFNQAKEQGWIQDFNYTNYDMAHAIMPTETLTRKEVQFELWQCYKHFYGSYTRNIAGVFSKNRLKRTLYRHMAGQHVLSKLRRLI